MTSLLASPPQIVLAVGILLFLSVLANKLSDRSGIPTLIMFLAIGMLAGSDGIGGIHFDNPEAANLVGVFGLAFILYSGGLDTDWRSVRCVLWRALLMATAGVVVTAGLVGLFAWKVLGYPLKEGLLLGAIISSTDAAAVFAIMRSRGVGLKGNLKPFLELESGSNDPMAVFLTVAAIGMIMNPTEPITALLPSLLVRMSVGVVVGVGVGWLFTRAINHLRLEYEGLYPVLSMSVVLLAYGLSEQVYGNGFVSVYACGIVIGNKDFLHRHYLRKFHDALGWLMQIVLFLVLGLLVFPSKLPGVVGPGLLVAAFLMFVARPVAVYLGLWRSAFSLRERTLIAWTGLRGAVPIVLATFPYMAGYAHSDTMFDIVFFIVLTSVILQGGTLMTVARWLGVDEPLVARPQYPIEFERREGVQSETREVDITPGAAAVGRSLSELGLPADALVLLIRRGPSFIVPRGHTTVEAFDTLLLLASPGILRKAQDILLGPRDPAP